MEFVKHNESESGSQKPNLPKYLFWDWDYDLIDWKNGYRSIIARVLERGNKDEWQELIRFYSEDVIVKALKTDIKYLPDYIIDNVCGYFNLQQGELACYIHKQLRKGHWI